MSTSVNQKVNETKKVNKNEKVTKLHQEILNIFEKINTKEPNLHDLLRTLSENFENENKKKKYIEYFDKYINLIPSNNKSASFNKFFMEHINIQLPKKEETQKVNEIQPLRRMNSTHTISQMEEENIRKNHYKIIYKEDVKEDVMIPFEFQTIISFENEKINENIKKYILVFINIVRKYYVDRLLEILTNYFFYQCNNAHSLDFSCSVVAVGSTAITSNYNVTISGIIYPHKIVNQFNIIFEKFWNNYSSIVFDTNIYGSTFFVTLPANFKIENNSPLQKIINNGYSQLEIKNKNNKLLNRLLYLPPKLIGAEKNETNYSEFLKKINMSQYKWLMLKVDLHKKEYNIQEDELSLNLNKILILLYKIIQNTNINTIPSNYINEIYQEKFSKNKNEFIPNNSSNNSNKLYQLKRREMYQHTLEDIEADQLRYESAILELNTNNTNNKNNKKIEQTLDILDDLINSISRSNYYGSETYLCMGTIYHILGYIQNLGNFDMKPEYFIASAIENYIDMYRYYQKMIKDQEYAIIKMSKYAYRIYHALSLLANKNQTYIYSNKLQLFEKILKDLKGAHHFDPSNKKELFNCFINEVQSNRKPNNGINQSQITFNEPNEGNSLSTNNNVKNINKDILKIVLNKIFEDVNNFLLKFIFEKKENNPPESA